MDQGSTGLPSPSLQCQAGVGNLTAAGAPLVPHLPHSRSCRSDTLSFRFTGFFFSLLLPNLPAQVIAGTRQPVNMSKPLSTNGSESEFEFIETPKAPTPTFEKFEECGVRTTSVSSPPPQQDGNLPMPCFRS